MRELAAELYDPGTGSWAATARMLAVRVDQTATLLPNGKVLVAGGYWGNVSYTTPGALGRYTGGLLDTSVIYDPATDKYTILSGMRGSTGTPPAISGRPAARASATRSRSRRAV